MEGRNTTPRMGIIKNEEDPTVQPDTSTSKIRAIPHSTPHSIIPPASNPPNSHSVASSEIEIPPRFQAILDRLKRNNPGLIETRYNEFLEIETSLGKARRVQESSDQIKL